MQDVIFYAAANETLGVIRDYVNAKNAPAPTLVRGVEVCLRIRLFAKSDGLEPYPLSALSRIVSWSWAMDSDFNETTAYKLIGDNSNISVAEVKEIVDEEEVTYTEVNIPMPNMNTEELSAWLGTEKFKSGLHGELVGINSDGKEVFILQLENFVIRNRISSPGNPVTIDPAYLTADQVRALMSCGFACEFSIDGSVWHTIQEQSDRFLRLRLKGNDSAQWSDPIGLTAGPKGDRGECIYTYVGYASDSTGTDFSTTAADNLKFRAEIQVNSPIETLTLEDFASAVWVKYIGDDGTGVGDMVKSVYDPDEDGKVLSSEEADHAAQADAVPWGGVNDKPTVFPSEKHTHSMEDLANAVSQKVYSDSTSEVKKLRMNYPILRDVYASYSGKIALEFAGIVDRNETAYSIQEGEIFTWEYHMFFATDVTDITTGSTDCTVTGVNIPETLKLINSRPTYHVFVIRAIYHSNAANKVAYHVNYAYSYEA